MAAAKIETEDGPCCPICLEQFNIPKQLPCAHSFCEKCLQSHINTEASKHEKVRYVKCPVCRNSASPSIKDRPTREWASLFPTNRVLESVLPRKSNVDHLCDACNNEGAIVPAEVFCVVCKEAMCGDCLKSHRKQTISKSHTILSLEELSCNPEHLLKLTEGFTCLEHHGEEIKYFCKDHNVPCCGTCFFQGHKICSKVIDLKEELPALLFDSKPDAIIADLKKIEIHLKKFMEINEACLKELEPQVNKMTDQIREVRNKINLVLDELEKRVKTEGSIICKEEVIRIQDENHECLSLIHAVRNSHYILEAVHKFGNNLQKFLMAEKMRSQLHSYCNQVVEKYEKSDTITIDVEFTPLIQSILSISLSELGKVVTRTSSNTLLLTCLQRPMKDCQSSNALLLTCLQRPMKDCQSSNTLLLTCLQRPMKDCQIEIVEVIDLKDVTGKTPWYTGVTFLPGDRVMLADQDNEKCILLSSSYQFITSHELTDEPWNVCVLDDQDVAVSLYNKSKIQILSVIGDVIRPVRMIKTKYKCNGIAAAGKGELVVNGRCGNNKSHWSLINTRGDVKCTHQYDSTYSYNNYIALNNMKTRVYVSVYKMHSLLCFDMDGRKLFSYSPDNLKFPCGVDVDRYDNIYVLGQKSNNIHQLSPEGSVIQVVNTGVPECPMAICIHKSKDILIITNGSESRKLYIYQLK